MYSYHKRKSLIHYSTHLPPWKIWGWEMENMKLNEPGRQKLGRYRSHVSRHSIQSYILTYYRLRKRKHLTDWAPTRRGRGGAAWALISASAVPRRGVGPGLHTFVWRSWSQTTVSPLTARAVSRRANYNPIPAGERCALREIVMVMMIMMMMMMMMLMMII